MSFRKTYFIIILYAWYHFVGKYEPRAMPSSGVIPFMQSYMCNLNAKPSCVDKQSEARAVQSR